MDVGELTKSELKNLVDHEPTEEFNAIVVFPNGKKHDSGYECMDFIFCNGNKIVGKVSAFSDVIYLGDYTSKTKNIWKIDCLPKSHLLRVFTNETLVYPDFIGSDFNVLSKKEKKEADIELKKFKRRLEEWQ